MTREVVILTKSVMNGGWCTAGLDISSGKWLRLVADTNHAPLSNRHLLGIKPLDAVSVELVREIPFRNHTEDCVIKESFGEILRPIGQYTIEQAIKLRTPAAEGFIFGNDAESITEDEMSAFGFTHSLEFVEVKQLVVNYSRKKAEFEFSGRHYAGISITDPDFIMDDGFVGGSVGYGGAYLVISMPAFPDRRSKRYHKFAAKIFLK